MFQSNSKYSLRWTVSATAWTGDTFLISPDFELGEDLETWTDSVSFVLKNATQIERMEITATGGVATVVKRGLDQSSSKVQITALKKQWSEGTVCYVAALASDMLDVDKSSWTSTVSSDTDFSGRVRFAGTMRLPVFADATARDAAYTAPVNGDKCLISGVGEQNYEGGAWHTMDLGTPTPNASDTVAGKVEIATQVETDAGTATGGTGAILAVTPATLVQHVVNVTASQAEAEAGSSNAKLMTPLATQKKIDYTRASTAEAITGTDNVKFVTPAGLTANVSPQISFATIETKAQTLDMGCEISGAAWINGASLSTGWIVTASWSGSVMSGSAQIYLSWSDDGITWTTTTLRDYQSNGAYSESWRSFFFSKWRYFRFWASTANANCSATISAVAHKFEND